ncbi:AAA family ATPase [Cupriavidus alkaliphilus]|uniref:AAA family ATPase n=1 Tax=Cupriavidus alkaliphilus TaxID=942866 RepID=UPI001618F946|nr:AAA family ATPase [Cupriavidus alkaliphilus]MBB2919241.1 putative type IV restriction endonuclease/energy-coupling factor transporter ATP-binding protein EcfA2 [Cupriavidus alkaliphilus]
MSIDTAKHAFGVLKAEWEATRSTIETEQDVRFRIINRVLTEVLGWADSQIETERHEDEGYVDYLMREGDRARLVVEAKRQQVLLIDTQNPARQAYKVGGAALKGARSGLAQATQYCLNFGAPFLALTNGFEWIAHWPMRGDGKAQKDHYAIVFPNHDAILENFAEFHDLFSRSGVGKNLFKIHINGAEGLSLTHSEPLRPLRDPKHLKRLERSGMARELGDVLNRFFSSMNGDDDPEMLSACFVESKESKEADATLQRLTESLLHEIETVGNDNAGNLQDEIRDAVEMSRKEFVLIVGNKGAGKSTFIDRFFRSVLAHDLRTRCAVLRVDLRDSNGDISAISTWLTEQLINLCESILFPGVVLNYEQLQGVFHSKYQRWAQGEYKHLYESNKIEFKIKFGDYISRVREDSPAEYLQAFLAHATYARQMMPCIIFDNTDHFSQPFQEAVFQYAQSIHRNVYSFVICPITDRTIWQLSKHGPLQSYDTKSFYLPVPPTKDILQKRVEFLKSKLAGPAKQSEQYLLRKGIRISVRDINAFAACVEEVFINTEYISRTVSWLCNYDIRRGLNLSKQIITSPQISIEDLVRIYISGKPISIPEFRIRKALFLGDYNQFRQDDSGYVYNVFSVFPDMLGSPLANCSILQCLKDKQSESADIRDSYMELASIASYLEPMGIPTTITKRHAQILLEYRLIEPFDPTESLATEATLVRLTQSGAIHLEFALTDSSYIEHVGLATSVREGLAADGIREKLRQYIDSSVAAQTFHELRKAFAQYVLGEDQRFCTIPSSYRGQIALREQFKSTWVRDFTSSSGNKSDSRKSFSATVRPLPKNR